MNRDQAMILGVCAAACAILWLMSEKPARSPAAPRDVTPPRDEPPPEPEPKVATVVTVEPVEVKP